MLWDWSSGSEPGFRGTQGCREIVTGFPWVITLLVFKSVLTSWGATKILIKQTEGSMRQKGWETLDWSLLSIACSLRGNHTYKIFLFLTVGELKQNIRKQIYGFEVHFQLELGQTKAIQTLEWLKKLLNWRELSSISLI